MMAIVFPVKKVGRPSNKPSAEKLAELYETLTSAEIGEMYGVKADTVKHWVWMYRKELAAEAAEQVAVQEEV